MRLDDEHFDAQEMLELSTDVDIDRELSARAFIEYVEIAWPLVEPASPFVNNWHVGAVCEHLEATARAEIRRLVINVPPGCTKSMLTTVLFPTWQWTVNPGWKVITTSYGDMPVKRDCLRSRGLLESKWWRARWGHQMHPRKAQWTNTDYRNREGGFRLGATVGGQVTSEHANTHIYDDPLKPLDVTGSLHVSKVALQRVETFETQTMATRFVDIANSVKIIVQQRLHEGDPTGRALQDADYVHLCLPMEYEPKVFIDGGACPIKSCKAQHRVKDPRTEPGELLDPIRKPREAVEKLKFDLGARGAAAQLDQRPAPAEGAIFKQHMIRRYRRAELPRFDRMIQSWDMTFKKTESGSFVCGQVWGQKGADCYLLDQIRERMGLTATCDAVRALSVKWPKAHKKYIEEKANGSAVHDTLKSELTGIIMVEPEGGKEARANAVEPMWEAGNVWLPYEDEAPWIGGFIEEHLGFPAVVNDDQVDTMSQALVKLRRHALERLRAAMSSGAARQLGR